MAKKKVVKKKAVIPKVKKTVAVVIVPTVATKPKERTHTVMLGYRVKKTVVIEEEKLPKGVFRLKEAQTVNGIGFGAGIHKVGEIVGPYKVTEGLMNSLLSKDAVR